MIDLLAEFQKCEICRQIPVPSAEEARVLTEAGETLEYFFKKHGIAAQACILPGTDYPKLMLLADNIDELVDEAQRHSVHIYASLFNSTSNLIIAAVPDEEIASDLPGDLGKTPGLEKYSKALVLRTPPPVMAQVIKNLIDVTPLPM